MKPLFIIADSNREPIIDDSPTRWAYRCDLFGSQATALRPAPMVKAIPAAFKKESAAEKPQPGVKPPFLKEKDQDKEKKKEGRKPKFGRKAMKKSIYFSETDEAMDMVKGILSSLERVPSTSRSGKDKDSVIDMLKGSAEVLQDVLVRSKETYASVEEIEREMDRLLGKF